MLPSEKFDYKSVDFSSFQGGSMQSNANQIQFQQSQVSKYHFISRIIELKYFYIEISRQQKKKERHRKWKKQKLNI